MLHYPVEADVLLFLRNIVASLQSFAKAHSVALTFESDREVLRLPHHPEAIGSDVMQLLCRIVTFTPQNQRVKLTATLIHEGDAFYVKLMIENTGVNLSLIKEIAANTRHPVIVHADRERSTAYELHWHLEKPIETPPTVSQNIVHPPDNVRGYYASVRERLSNHFKKQENRVALLAAENPKEAVFLQKIIAVVNVHISDETFDVEQLARSMAMSRMQLHRRMKPLVNQTPAHYIRDVRLKKAKELIEQTDVSIGDISFQVGFQSQSHFTKAFIEKFGVRPMAYRRGKTP